MRVITLTMLLLICALPVFGQQQVAAVELGPEIYGTIRQSRGYGWLIYGRIYSSGTFTAAPGQQPPRGACEFPADVQPIGTYAVYGNRGDEGDHYARYRLTFGFPQNTARSYVFEGNILVFNDEGGIPGGLMFDAARLLGGQPSAGGGSLVYTPRSQRCFGGRVQLFFEP